MDNGTGYAHDGAEYTDNGTEGADNGTGTEGDGVTNRQRLRPVLSRVDECRQDLERLSRELGSLTHPQVVALSHRLDRMILELYANETSGKPRADISDKTIQLLERKTNRQP
ncbi:MAG: Spo0E family sporulation regulatory protein-aspartic acid phosphatase [Bacillota bacterium]